MLRSHSCDLLVDNGAGLNAMRVPHTVGQQYLPGRHTRIVGRFSVAG
ncbi:hypothetical protein [Enterobacter roggenkampii]|nr:hypothetical protein [Enterobacter roggenkampii]